MRLDFSEVKDNKNAMEGEQVLTIFGAKEQKSANGTNMLVLDMKDAEEGFVRDNVCLEGPGAFKAQMLFKALGLSDEETKEKFGFMINAFKYGTPPHAGLALGLDRVVALLAKTNSIRDVIAFPKNSNAKCLMTDAPAMATEEQMRELHLRTTVKVN